MTPVRALEVLPADAGMIRFGTQGVTFSQSAPRRRGDDPVLKADLTLDEACSPQTRG